MAEPLSKKKKKDANIVEAPVLSEGEKMWAFIKRHINKILIVMIILSVGLIVAYRVRQYYDKQFWTPEADFNGLVAKQGDPRANPAEILNGYKALAEQTGNERIAALACVRTAAIYASNSLHANTDDASKEYAAYSAEYYRKVIDNFPGMAQSVAQAHVGLGKLAESAGNFQAARAEYETALQTGPAEYPVMGLAEECIKALDGLETPVYLAASQPTLPALPSTQPATQPATTNPITIKSVTTKPTTLPTEEKKTPAPMLP